MRSLVTGGAGFVGQALRQHLADAGDDVITTDRASGGPDITDREAVATFIGAHDVDVIYHLAAQAHVPTSWRDPIGTFRVNAEGTQNVLDAIGESSDTRVIVVTSAEVYGAVPTDRLPISESEPLRPVTPYASSKVAADAVALQAFLGRNVDVIRARAFNHIGPGQRTSFVAAGLAERIALAERVGGSTVRVGNLSPRRDFTDVRDVVRAYRLLAQHGAAGEVYNVCSGVDRAIGDIADGLVALATSTITVERDPDLERDVDVPVVRGDRTRIEEDTGWSPRIDLEQSLADILEDARRRIDD
ncbi:MAG: GDP-mannose 4,6-dehydratase [Acidimicrobiales bacterium]